MAEKLEPVVERFRDALAGTDDSQLVAALLALRGDLLVVGRLRSRLDAVAGGQATELLKRVLAYADACHRHHEGRLFLSPVPRLALAAKKEGRRYSPPRGKPRPWAQTGELRGRLIEFIDLALGRRSRKSAEPRKHANGTLDERALKRAKEWQRERSDWTVTELAKAEGSSRSALLSRRSKNGLPKCPLFVAFWNEVQLQRAEAKRERLGR